MSFQNDDILKYSAAIALEYFISSKCIIQQTLIFWYEKWPQMLKPIFYKGHLFSCDIYLYMAN